MQTFVPNLLCLSVVVMATAGAESSESSQVPFITTSDAAHNEQALEPKPVEAAQAVAPAHQQSPGPFLLQAQQAYAGLRFDDCRVALDRALREPSNTRAQLIEIYRLRGLVEAAMGQPVAAKRAFANMIVLDPQAQLGEDYAPKILRTYEAARASLPGEQGLQVVYAGRSQVVMGEPAQIALGVDDTLALVEQIVVRYRVGSQKSRQQILNRADRGVVKIPAAQLPVGEEVYFIEVEAWAQNAYGATLAVLQPKLRVQVVPSLQDEQEPWYRQWWLWASLSAGLGVFALAGVGAAIWLAPQDTRPRDVEVLVP